MEGEATLPLLARLLQNTSGETEPAFYPSPPEVTTQDPAGRKLSQFADCVDG